MCQLNLVDAVRERYFALLQWGSLRSTLDTFHLNAVNGATEMAEEMLHGGPISPNVKAAPSSVCYPAGSALRPVIPVYFPCSTFGDSFLM